MIAQVRNLQALISEREEEVKDLKYDKANLEIETENFQQRLRALDESEHRYKEENWNLETKLQEFSAQQKEAGDREKKLTQALNLSKAEKAATQKELDEVKLSHSKLNEEHSASVKHHDIELGTAKRNIAMAEGERAAMQRKIDELASQNQELAKAFSTQRGRLFDREAAVGTSDEDQEARAERITPEHSPPASPIKGTPRHSMLETETLKSSLQHAQRTIQSQRSYLHREKTEKLELKRLVQDLRDDLEKARNESTGNASNKRNRKAEAKDQKKPPRLLGSFRSSRQEVVQDDPDWEDQQDLSPRTASIQASPLMRQAGDFSIRADPSDHFDTANEGGESAFETAFETANERGTETEDFETVNEEFSGSDDVETETEGTSRGFGRMKKAPALPAGLARYSNRDSFHSTASTSGDEDDYSTILRTPTATISSQRSSRFKLSRGPFSRSSRQASEEPNLRSSPASFVSSAGGTPQPGGQSLFAELQDLEGSDEESVGGATPSRRSTRSMTPGSFSRTMSPPPAVPPLPKVIMVDSGVMTEPVKFAPNLRNLETYATADSGMGTEPQDESLPGSPVSVIARGRPMSMESVIGPSGNRQTQFWPSIHEEDYDGSRPLSSVYSDAGAQHDPDMEEKLAQFPAPPTMLPPILPPPPSLSLSTISSEAIEPREEISTPPKLTMTSIWNETVEPLAEPTTPPPELSISTIIAEHLEPREETVNPPNLTMTSIWNESVEPLAEPVTPPPQLSFSGILIENVEPVAEPETPLPPLSLSTIVTEHLEPRSELEIPPPDLTFSTIVAENLEPLAEPEIPPADLSFTTLAVEHVEPRAEPEKPLPPLSLTNIYMESVEPIAEPEVLPPALALSSILSEVLEPIALPEVPPVMFIPPPPALSMSSILREHVEPIEPVVPVLPTLSLSTISREQVEPLSPVAPSLTLSTISREHVEPIAPKIPELGLSTIIAEHVEPVAEPEPTPILTLPIIPVLPELSHSAIVREHIEPITAPEPALPEPPRLGLSMIQTEHVEPKAEPEPEAPKVPELTFTTLLHEHVEPMAEPEPIIPQLSISTIMGQHVEPVATVPPELTLSTIAHEAVEPITEPEPEAPKALDLTFSTILGEHVEPIAEVEPVLPELTVSSIACEHVEPIAEPEPTIPELSISTIIGEHVEPAIAEPPALALSSIAAEAVEPVSEPRTVVLPPPLSLSSISAEHWEPREEPRAVPPDIPLAYSNLSTQQVEPVSEPNPIQPPLGLSSIVVQDVQPVVEPPPSLVMSSIAAEGVEPKSPVEKKRSIPNFSYSQIESIATSPVSARSPRRDGFILPRNMESPFIERDAPKTTTDDGFIIAEDETRQSLRDASEAETPESQRPFKEISTNTNDRPSRKALAPTSDQGAQTSLTAEAIDEMLSARSRPPFAYERSNSMASPGTPGTTGTVKIHKSYENLGSPVRGKGRQPDDYAFETGSNCRPGSSASGRTSILDAPPLPSNHRQVIEAARTNSAHGSQTNMGPPLWPASALKRPTTPGQARPMTPVSTRGTPTPRANRASNTNDSLEVQSPAKLTARSRQSSVSSFASEIDTRFNMRPGDMGIDPRGFGPNSDPRMIQAITQTMIGEYLWKYTRKAGRGELSGNRHRRYFWVHPYTRTLNWSDRDPSTAGRTELRAKSVPIEAVRVVTDDNPMPPGLHRKSLVVVSPGRTIKFTCATGQRHETWFNALSYLLLRTNNEGQSDAEDMVENITREDVEEFNPQFGRQPSNGNRPRAPPSLSSYNSRTTRNESPAVGMSMNIPTLTPKPQKTATAQRPSLGTLSKLSGYLKPGSSFSSRRGRGMSNQDNNIYEASEVHDSAEDLREIIERQDRESDRLENVRACCDGKNLKFTAFNPCVLTKTLGKHDVGTLHHLSLRRGRSSNHTHSHPVTASNTMGSFRSRT